MPVATKSGPITSKRVRSDRDSGRSDLFRVEDDGGPTVSIRNVPCFKTHDDRDYNCDEQWLDRCVADFIAQKAESAEIGGERYAMLPSLTVGHTPEDNDAPEPPAAGFVDNLRRQGDTLFCDFVGVPRDIFERMQRNEFPYRSAEVIPTRHRLTNVSLLGGRYPHFPLPVMRFAAQLDGVEVQVHRYTLRGAIMATAAKTPAKTNREGRSNSNVHRVANPASGQRYTMGETNGGDASGATQPGAASMDIKAIAAEVAKLLAQSQANAAGGPLDNAAAYAADEDPDKPGQGVDGSGTQVEAGQGDDIQDVSETDQTEANQAKGTGTSNSDTGKYGAAAAAEIRKYQRENAELKQRLDDLTKSVGDLQRHNAAQGVAAKRQMLKSKCRELLAQGYALGDEAKVDRHVNLMMRMEPEEVKQYVDDTLKSFPRVTTATQRHGVGDVIRRPGSESENQRYYLDHKESLDGMGLTDHHLLELGDLLS